MTNTDKGAVVQTTTNGAKGFRPSRPSWGIRRKEDGRGICETFDWRKITALNTEKYEAIPIVEYLASLNKASSND